jgi:hypothetical protein
VKINEQYRAVGERSGDTIVWVWGGHCRETITLQDLLDLAVDAARDVAWTKACPLPLWWRYLGTEKGHGSEVGNNQ